MSGHCKLTSPHAQQPWLIKYFHYAVNENIQRLYIMQHPVQWVLDQQPLDLQIVFLHPEYKEISCTRTLQLCRKLTSSQCWQVPISATLTVDTNGNSKYEWLVSVRLLEGFFLIIFFTQLCVSGCVVRQLNWMLEQLIINFSSASSSVFRVYQRLAVYLQLYNWSWWRWVTTCLSVEVSGVVPVLLQCCKQQPRSACSVENVFSHVVYVRVYWTLMVVRTSEFCQTPDDYNCSHEHTSNDYNCSHKQVVNTLFFIYCRLPNKFFFSFLTERLNSSTRL